MLGWWVDGWEHKSFFIMRLCFYWNNRFCKVSVVYSRKLFKKPTQKQNPTEHTLISIADTLPWSAGEGQIVKAKSPSLEWCILPQLVRHPSKESKAEETQKKRKMITIKKLYKHYSYWLMVYNWHKKSLNTAD